ncbi:hypothetical protein ACSBR2_019854 [Camellia fascicularis]
MSKRGRGGSAGNKFRMSLGLPVAATVNCADNTWGEESVHHISEVYQGEAESVAFGLRWRHGDGHREEGKPDLRKKVMPAVIVRQRKPWRRKDGVFMYFEGDFFVLVSIDGTWV